MIPGGDGPVKAEGVADRKHLLTDEQIRRFTDGDRLQQFFRGVDLEDGDILVGRGANQHRLPRRIIGHGDLDAVGIADHMIIGDDPSLIVPDEAGSGSLRDLDRIE